MTPMPPCCASAMASKASVTVSIADEQSGIFKLILREKRVLVSTSAGSISENAGMSRTSSKVRPSWMFLISISNCIQKMPANHLRTCRSVVKYIDLLRLVRRRFWQHHRLRRLARFWRRLCRVRRWRRLRGRRRLYRSYLGLWHGISSVCIRICRRNVLRDRTARPDLREVVLVYLKLYRCTLRIQRHGGKSDRFAVDR